MNNIQQIKQLLEKCLTRELSAEENGELFDRLRTIHRPEELDAYFQSRWNVDRTTDTHTDLRWEEVLDENHRQSVLRRSSIKRAQIRQLWQLGVAASVLLLVSLVWWKWDHGTDYVTYSTGFGETKNIVLDDGTSVVLNANSELIWKTDWNKDQARYIGLSGEAYFKVSHLNLETGAEMPSSDFAERMPFRVKTSNVVIDVLGTTFNVADRRGETQVYLEEGSVKLGLLEKEIMHEKTERNIRSELEKEMVEPVEKVIMEPGESMGYSAVTKQLEKNNSKASKALTEWKDGTLVYQDVLFGDMLDHMEDIYGKKFEVRDTSLLTKNVNFGVPYEKWGTVKNLMEITLGIEIMSGEDNKTIIKKRKE